MRIMSKLKNVYKRIKLSLINFVDNLVFRVGFEPTTPALSRQCSEPTELTERISKIIFG